jgi:hypothetical protein
VEEKLMEVVETEILPWKLIVPNTRGGDVYRKVIHAAEGGEKVSCDVRIELFGEGEKGYKTNRHRHDFEQLRFAVSGQMDLGFATLDEGEVGYFPANAFYGPQKCEGSIILIAQWGDHFITQTQSDQAVAELSEVGEFVDGVYKSVDAKGKPFNKDSLNAIWEHVFQRPYVAQRPRYPQPIIIAPEAFGWSDADGATRVRHLGVFTENDVEIRTIEWIEDGVFRISPNDRRPTLLFTTSGSFVCEGRQLGVHTGLWAEPGESFDLQGSQGSRALVVNFPAPDSQITLVA